MTAKNTLSVLKILFKMKMCSTTDTPPTVRYIIRLKHTRLHRVYAVTC